MKKEKTKVKKHAKIKRNVKGITLIALVVTIIVLLILAGIALNLTIGQNGIFSRAEQAANTWRNVDANEQLTMGEFANMIKEYMPPEPISNEDLQISADTVYYADINDDGTVDGVIFADLAGVEETGEWGNNGDGTYTIPKEDNFKSYYIKSENYTDDSFKKTGKVIAPIDGTSGNDRFYLMALENARGFILQMVSF